MANVVDIKCPNCGAPLKFDPEIKMLRCEFCDGVFEEDEVKGRDTTFDKEASLVEESKGQEEVDEALLYSAARAEDSGNWDKSVISDDWKADMDKLKVYNCPSCGAGLICEKVTVANSCPYCGNTTISEGDIQGSLRPEYIIPFSITKEQAIDALKEHYKGKFLLPKQFKSENTLNEIKGIYVPFWLFDGEAAGAATYNCTIRTSINTGNKTIITTRHYRAFRGGDVTFKHIPTDAAKKMPDDIMDSIEPFDYSKMVPFELSYLSGFFADKYDVTIEENSQRADNRCRNSIRDILRDSVTGYTSITENNFSASIKRGEVHYAMLPVYMLRTRWKNEDYIFAVNGQSGKMVGNLPEDPRKTAIGGLIGAAIGAVIGAVVAFFLVGF